MDACMIIFSLLFWIGVGYIEFHSLYWLLSGLFLFDIAFVHDICILYDVTYLNVFYIFISYIALYTLLHNVRTP